MAFELITGDKTIFEQNRFDPCVIMGNSMHFPIKVSAMYGHSKDWELFEN